MTDKPITATENPKLPANPDIDRAALILFDGKHRERFDFYRHDAESQVPIDHGPIIGPIIDRTIAAIWPHTLANMPPERDRAARDAKSEPVGELLNPNVVKLIEGEVYDPLTDLTYQAGEQMSAEVWKRWAGPLPTATADDAPVGYQLGDSAQQAKGDQHSKHHITITARLVEPGTVSVVKGEVTIAPDGDTHDRFPGVNAPADFKAAVVAVLRELHPVTADHIGKPRDGFEVVMTVPGFATADEARAFQSKLDDTFMGMAEAEGRAATSIARAASVTTRSPSEAHAIAGATQLDEVLSGSTEGISQTILAAAAEAAALEPVSEAGGDDYDLSPEGIMADRFDRLVDYWESQGIPASMEMKLRELLADETPDPALMSDVLFVIDAHNGKSRAVFTEDGVRLEGNALGDGLLHIVPQIMESAMQYGRMAQAAKRREKDRAERVARQFDDLHAAGKFIRSAIYSGEGDAIDAATALIAELADWIDGQEFLHSETGCQGCAPVDAPLTDEERARIKAAIESQIGGLRAVNSQMPEPEPTKEELLAGIEASRDAINAKGFDHEAGDAYLRECCGSTETYDMAAATLSQARLDRIRGEAASATAGIVDRMENRPEGKGYHYDSAKLDEISHLRYVLAGENAQEVGKAMARAATTGKAFLHVTHDGHADGFEVKLMQPESIDRDGEFKTTPEPQDSDAPDGVGADETVDPRDSAFISAKHYAKRYGVGILVRGPGGRYSACSPRHVKVKKNKGVVGPEFIAVSRNLT